MTINSAVGPQAHDVVEDQDKPYRLWCKARTKGNPIIILVHGAVVPTLNGLYRRDCPNNYRYGFYDLDSLLYHDFQYNVFTFEYADESVGSLGYINYHKLYPYVKCLIEAVGNAKDYAAMQGPVTFVAHSMGGLIARCAAKKMAAGTISKIITLDTGHLGFGLANLIESMLPPDIHLPPPFECCDDVEEGSSFMQHLNEGFDANNPTLVSLAACFKVPMPPPATPIRAVGFHSSSIRQVPDSENCTHDNYNNPVFKILQYNHLSITQIKNSTDDVYQNIIAHLH